jgi:hypothetical protein
LAIIHPHQKNKKPLIRHFSAIVCLLLIANTYSAGAFVTDPPDTIPPSLRFMASDDESDETEEDFGELEDVAECLIRNCDIYSVWDTTRINPYGVDLRQKKDTTLIRLFTDKNCDYSHPVCGEVTSDFGFRRHRYHYGIDINLETGDAVLNAFEGTVRVAKYSPTYGYYVIVRHLNGLETLYAHLSSILTAPGQYLQAGDVLGLGGNTGRSRGSHLHFEVRFLGQQINPRDLISFEEYACLNPEIAIHSKRFDYLKEVEVQKASIAARKYYKVRRGDTLLRIAKRNRTTVAKLCKLNRIGKRTVLRPGRKLRVA